MLRVWREQRGLAQPIDVDAERAAGNGGDRRAANNECLPNTPVCQDNPHDSSPVSNHLREDLKSTGSNPPVSLSSAPEKIGLIGPCLSTKVVKRHFNQRASRCRFDLVRNRERDLQMLNRLKARRQALTMASISTPIGDLRAIVRTL